MAERNGVDASATDLRSDELTLEQRRIRAEIIRGLVLLASAEPTRARGVQGGPPGPTPEERRKRVETALPGLERALARLIKAFGRLPDPGAADNHPTPAEMAETARERVAGLIVELKNDRRYHDDGVIDEKRLDAIPREVQKPVSALLNAWSPVPKIFVAVHGIGDQFQNETVQSVAFRVCEYVGQPAAIPLGRFRGPGARVGVFLPEPDRDPQLDCGFAEIYWADVPRVPAADRHILEEPKKWARTLVERLRLRAPDDLVVSPEEARRDDERLEELIEELIQGVAVADRLVFLADKAGLFKFDLSKLLNDYLNDVQVVAEFEDYRNELLEIFDEVMERIHRYFFNSEIYIIAHSEGTVVAFMGLLKGISQGADWVDMVRGYMTIGSPLNKHVRFWPELFDQFALPTDPPARRIPWKNYYDYGDPIGYDLDPTRQWMAASGRAPGKTGIPWSEFFKFDEDDDIGFTRYYFPGAAHNDYWGDPEVFGHFIRNVVDATGAVLTPSGGHDYSEPRRPGTIGVAWVTSWVLPYVLAALLLFVACYVLYKPLRACLDPVGARFETAGRVARDVFGVWSLVAGMTLLARMPRLSRLPKWRALAGVLALVSLGYYAVSAENRRSVAMFLNGFGKTGTTFHVINIALLAVLAAAWVFLRKVNAIRPLLWALTPVVGLVVLLRFVNGYGPRLLLPDLTRFDWASLGVVVVAWAVGVMAAVVSWQYPRSGTKPLIHTGGLIVLLSVVIQLALTPDVLPPGQRLAVARVAREQGKVELRRFAPQVDQRDPLTAYQTGPLVDAAALQVVTDAALEVGPVWPVFVALAAFLYLWWLAVITFDLTFVWHLYIRSSGAQAFVEDRIETERRAIEARTGSERAG